MGEPKLYSTDPRVFNQLRPASSLLSLSSED